jgi:hypothetical protein
VTLRWAILARSVQNHVERQEKNTVNGIRTAIEHSIQSSQNRLHQIKVQLDKIMMDREPNELGSSSSVFSSSLQHPSQHDHTVTSSSVNEKNIRSLERTYQSTRQDLRRLEGLLPHFRQVRSNDICIYIKVAWRDMFISVWFSNGASLDRRCRTS